MAKKLDDIWLKSAVAGSLWACVEIVLGSFLHNLHLPFAGSFLTAVALVFLVALIQIWPEPGLVWRAGLVCAMMKSLSPGAVILGPMVAILAEALLFESGIRLFGRNQVGCLIAGCLAMLWLPVQKIGRLLVFYGRDMVDLYLEMLAHLQQRLDLMWVEPQHFFLLLASLYLAFAVVAVVIGWRLGQRIKGLRPLSIKQNSEAATVEKAGSSVPRSLFWLGGHFVAVVGGLWLFTAAPFIYAAFFCLSYSALCHYRYRQAYRRFCKPKFWLMFILITVLAGLFLGTLNDPQLGFKWQSILIGLKMNLRAVLLLVAFTALGVELGNPWIKQHLHRRGLGQFSTALELSFRVMPQMLASLMAQNLPWRSPLQALALMLRQMDSWLEAFRHHCQSSPVCLLVGDRGCGKTSTLQMLVAELELGGYRVGGLIAKGLWRDNERYGFDLLDLKTKVNCPLCRRDADNVTSQHGPYGFFATGLEFGVAALGIEALREVDLVIIDEIGPLELRGEGWAQPLTTVIKELSCPVILTVRSRLSQQVVTTWNLDQVVHWDATQITIAEMVSDLDLCGHHAQDSSAVVTTVYQ